MRLVLSAYLAFALSCPASAGESSKPGLTMSEQAALTFQIARCWNLGALSNKAMETRLVVAFDLDPSGRPRHDTIRLQSHDAPSEEVAGQAFRGARRAIIRCGADGYDLPDEKYDHWRRIEIVFSPDDMRWR